MKQGVGKAFGTLRKLNIKATISSPNALRKQAAKMGRVFSSRTSTDSPHKTIAELLYGTWEIDLTNVTKVSAAIRESSIDTSNMSPMVNISHHLDVILLPLANEITSIESINEYLSSIRLNSGSSVSPKILILDDGGGSDPYIPVQLIISNTSHSKLSSHPSNASNASNASNGTHDSSVSPDAPDAAAASESKDNNDSQGDEVSVILEGNILTEEFCLVWADGSRWRQIRSGSEVMSDNDDGSGGTQKMRNIGGDTNASGAGADHGEQQENLNNLSRNDLIARAREYKNELSTLREKQQMAKMQTQAAMAQLADLSTNYAELEKGKKEAESKYFDIHNQLEAARLENQTIKQSFNTVNDQLRDAQSAVVYEQVQEIQVKLTKIREENELLKQTNSSQQEDIISLREQLQALQIASKQYVATIEELKKTLSDKEEECQNLTQMRADLTEKWECLESEVKEVKHSKELTISRHEDKLRSYEESHKKEIQQLERGFQETLLRNNRKIEDLEVVRNNIVKKNASLTKDIKRLMSQIHTENLSKNPSNGSHTESDYVPGSPHLGSQMSGADRSERMERENERLKDELARKSQALVEALRALAYVHAEPGKEHDEEEAIRHQQEARETLQKLSHLAEYQGQFSFDAMGSHSDLSLNDGVDLREQSLHSDTFETGTNGVNGVNGANGALGANGNAPDARETSGTPRMGAQGDAEQSDGSSNTNESSSNRNNSNNVGSNSSYGGRGSEDDIGSRNISGMNGMGGGPDGNDANGKGGKKKRFGLKRLKQAQLGTKMKAGLSKGLTSMKTMKAHMQSPAIGVVQPKRASKTKQQLSTHVKTLQSLANELSVTIEQKEEILESLRFANAYLGKRVIALETWSELQPGQDIPDEDKLISRALDIRADVFRNETKNDDDDNNIDNSANNVNDVNHVNNSNDSNDSNGIDKVSGMNRMNRMNRMNGMNGMNGSDVTKDEIDVGINGNGIENENNGDTEKDEDAKDT